MRVKSEGRLHRAQNGHFSEGVALLIGIVQYKMPFTLPLPRTVKLLDHKGTRLPLLIPHPFASPQPSFPLAVSSFPSDLHLSHGLAQSASVFENLDVAVHS